VWQSVVNGQTLKFHLAGINNQNFIMRDEQTGSWWQQITGEAIQGSLKGQKLTPIDYDELSYGVWKRENPNGRVLRPEEEKAETSDWEKQVGKMRVTTSVALDSSLTPRDLIVGVTVNNESKAYPFSAIEKQNPILDILGGIDVVIILGQDGKSVRVFERTVDGKKLEFLVKPDTGEIVDAETGSTWDFSGQAISGDLAGKQLTRIQTLKDYWFDWHTYHPNAQLYTLGNR
jgi:hypothetical protein